jgi:hypothetical protein
MRRSTFALALLAVAAVAAPAGADPIGVVKESGRITGHAVRDGAQTVGRTVRDFFTGGPRKAKHTWRSNAARTRADAHTGKVRIEREAHE